MAFERDKFRYFTDLLLILTRGTEIDVRCKTGNFLLEERLTEAREDSYEQHLKNPIDTGIWLDGHDNYVSGKIKVPHGDPETFTPLNTPNLLSPDPDQSLVRLEKLDRLSHLAGLPPDEIISHFREYIEGPKGPPKKDNELIVKSLLDKWNQARDARPLFAGFWGDVRDIFTDAYDRPIKNDDWPEQLRDRFGLGHLDPQGGAPIPVAAFRYPVGTVTAGNPGKPKVIAIPTVLDSSMSPFFCPTPTKKGWPEGQAVDLSEGDENSYRISSEILHMAIEYKPEFLYKAGWITKSPGKTLEQARQIHFLYLKDGFADPFRVIKIN